MIDDPVILAGAYAVIAAGFSVTVAKVSPTIGPRLRHVFSGTAPLAAVFGNLLAGADSVTLHGMDLLAAGGLVALGIATSSLVGKLVPTADGKDRSLISR